MFIKEIKIQGPKGAVPNQWAIATDKIYGLNMRKWKQRVKTTATQKQRFTDSSKDLAYEQGAGDEH